MKPDDFQFLATLAKERSGLVLTQDKAYLNYPYEKAQLEIRLPINIFLYTAYF